jgi:hypothetical protein
MTGERLLVEQVRVEVRREVARVLRDAAADFERRAEQGGAETSAAREWWLCTRPPHRGLVGQIPAPERVLGPFASADLAVRVRVYVEKVRGTEDFQERVEVIEKEPVLDLLERVAEWLQVPDYQRYGDVVTAKAVIGDVEALLRAHGRLKGAGDE